MPTYQYECSKCGYALEKFQSMMENRLKKCPKCGKSSLERLIGTGSGTIFKGSGFYETDYKRESPASDSKPSSKPSKETKPAQKAGPCSNNCACHPQ